MSSISARKWTKHLLLISYLSSGTQLLISGFTPHPAFRSFNRPNLPSSCRAPAQPLGVSAAPAATSSTTDETESSQRDDSDLSDESDDDKPSMPWSDFQEWALRDSLPKYIVTIPVKRSGKTHLEAFALWRTLAREVTELSGYSIDFLQDMHVRQLKQNITILGMMPGILPLLDEFEFAPSGGLSGRVYGIPGVADGSKIESSAVVDVQMTVPKGYVQTDDGAVAYELGVPLGDFYSLDGTDGRRALAMSKQAVATAAGLAKGGADGLATVEDPDTMLVRLGVSTAILLAGATAVNMLSHHLTVNVFWV